MTAGVLPAVSVVCLTLGLSVGADQLFDGPKPPEERVLDPDEYERAFGDSATHR